MPGGPRRAAWFWSRRPDRALATARAERSGGFDPWGWTAGLIVLGLVFVAVFGERLAPHEPIYFVVEHGRDPRPFDPGTVFAFGSDVLGRDLVSLVLTGARTTLTVVLLAGLARVLAGVLAAAIGGFWRPARSVIEVLAGLVSAVPATLAALLIVKVFVKSDTTVLLFIAALVLMGWAGPFRIIRAEVDRLAHAPFTEGARALGVSGRRLFLRHHLPHLVPMIATNLSQQAVASLVLVAELGVLGAFVGTTRLINIEESLSFVRPGPVNAALISDASEWGGLLASSRTVEALWVARWLILVPGVAFALTAVAVACAGFAIARRYSRRDLVEDLRGPGALAFGAAIVAMVLVQAFVPERYAHARDWAAAARSEVRSTEHLETAFSEAGLRPVDRAFAVRREVSTIRQTGPATVTAGSVTLAERWPRELRDVPDRERNMWAFLTATIGGGIVEAPLVYAARGISPGDYVPAPRVVGIPAPPDFAQQIRDFEYADDYSGIDVRGKIVVLIRAYGIQGQRITSTLNGYALGPAPEDAIGHAIKRGAVGVIFIDPSLWLYNDLPAAQLYGLGELRGGTNPYLRAERLAPPTSEAAMPVVILSDTAAKTLLVPLGIDPTPYFRFDERGSPRYRVSTARDLGVVGRIEVPLRREVAAATSIVGEIPNAAETAGRILIWSVRRPHSAMPAGDVLAGLARALAGSRVPFVLVDFDPGVDPTLNAQHIREVLGGRRIVLVIVLDRLEGDALTFTTPHGDLIPALDLYAERSGARFITTRETSSVADIAAFAPFIDLKTVVIRSRSGEADRRSDTAAVLGYLAGRLALGAPEVPR